MHLGNGAITPGCALITWGAAVAGLGLATWAARRTALQREELAQAGVWSALIFAAQMVNVQVLPFSSGHLVGGVLLAWVLGPARGAWAMALVLTLQALLLGDGGLMALGANIVNMALLPALLVTAVLRRQARCSPTTGQGATAGLTAALAVCGAAVLIVLQVSLFRSAESLTGLGGFAAQMVGIHAWIGLLEGLLTCGILVTLAQTAPQTLPRRRPAALALAAGGLVLVGLPWASGQPDGYEAAAQRSGLSVLLAEDGEVLATLGQVNATVCHWQQSLVGQLELAVGSQLLLAAVATALAGLLAYGLSAVLARPAVGP